jgi:hypothetical protein
MTGGGCEWAENQGVSEGNEERGGESALGGVGGAVCGADVEAVGSGGAVGVWPAAGSVGERVRGKGEGESGKGEGESGKGEGERGNKA